MSATLTTLDGSTISTTITGITAHTWTADANGLFTTTANLQAEWTANYATMLAGHADQLTPMQRNEGNAEAVIENTAAAKLSTAQQSMLRQDLQRQFDVVDAGMRIDQTTYGIDPTLPFNTYTYLTLVATVQANEQLTTLGIEGHGLNSPPNPIYDGYTTDFQNKTDGKTDFVGGGIESGSSAFATFLDDVVSSNTMFPVVMHNGVLEELNQNGTNALTLADTITAANETLYKQVFVASDFSTNPNAVGAIVAVPNAKPAPPLPIPPAPLAGVTALDGSALPETITGLTAHTWTADATGLYTTLADLGTEWKADYAAMLAGQAGNLTPLQRMEGNAEAVLENTAAIKLSAVSLASFRSDLQREFDAIDAAMRINQSTYGINPNTDFTAYSYLKMEETLQGNEVLKELGYQGHGVNSPPLTKYDGFTTDFQNKTDGKTFYVGGGPGNAENAISAFLDDDVLTHAPFPVVENNGVQTQLNQNGNLESPLITDALVAANNTAFDRVYVASDFNTDSTATGAIVMVPPPTNPPTATPGSNGVSILDSTTGQATTAAVTAYVGPVPGLQWSYINVSPDNLNINAALPNAFLHSGSGNDAINVSAVGGTNVMDGGTGSNFLVGGTGPGSADTFYVDDRIPAADTWSTVVNFHAGDATTIFGLTQSGTTNAWADAQGATGYTGLTLHATTTGKPTASVSLAGFTTADLTNGRLSATFGTESDNTPYLYIYDKT